MDFQNLNLNLYLIRHASPLNKAGYWTSPKSPLDEKGRLQAELLGTKLEKVKFHRIISSPFIRTRQTAEILLNYLEYDGSITIKAWLGEIDLGEFVGKSKEMIKNSLKDNPLFNMDKIVPFEPLVSRLLASTKEFMFPGGENLNQFWNRIETGFFGLLDEYRNNEEYNVGLIGHGGSFTVIQALLQNKSLEDRSYAIPAIEMGKYALLRIFKNRVIYLKLN